MLSQIQIISKVLETHDYSIIILNNLEEKYFFDCRAEFLFIKNHYEQYNVVPDKITFLKNFPDFNFVEVTEPDNYLVSELLKDYNQSYIVSKINTKLKKYLETGEIDKAITEIKDIADKLDSNAGMTYTDIIHNPESRLNAYLEMENDTSKYYVTTGFKELDQILGGWNRKDDYALIVARTNMGKSFVALKTAIAAAEQGLTVAYYSGEMTANLLGFRLDSMIGHLSNGALSHGNSNIHLEYDHFLKTTLQQVKGSIKVATPLDLGGPATVDALQTFIKKVKADILVVDQISFLEDQRNGRQSFEKVANISKDLKKLQVMNQIPIIAVCQQNRTKNDDGSQDTTQIGLSDRLGQDSTVILFLDRPKGEEDVMKITIGKSRNSQVGATLNYKIDLNKGFWHYIPKEDDIQIPSRDLEKIRNSYNVNATEDEKNVF